MDRYSELEGIRRSLAMLPPNTPAGMSREDAMSLISELQGVEHRLKRLKDELQRVISEALVLRRRPFTQTVYPVP